MSEPLKRNRALEALGPVVIAASLCAGAGATINEHFAGQEAAKAARSAAAELARVRIADEQRITHLEALLDTERKENAKDAGARHVHFLAFTRNAARVRGSLESMLADSRRANDACSGRIARIAEDYGSIGDLLGQSVELLEGGQSEIGRLEGENRRLAGQVAGWQEYDRGQHIERITVTAAKR